MDKKRLLIIGHTYTAPVNRLKFEHMAKDRRFEFLVVTPQKWRNYLTVADNTWAGAGNRCRTHFVDVWWGWHPVVYLIPQLAQIIREFKPHLIYCEQEPICLVSLQAAICGRNTPVIFFSWENVNRQDVRYRLFSPIRTLNYRKSLFMTAGTREAAAVIRSHGYTKPIYITPILGVSEELFSPQNQQRLRSSLTHRDFVIGYVGRFVEEKDVLTLLRAVSLLAPSINWHLVLVGGGPLKSQYERLIRGHGMGDRVTFQSSVSHDEVPKYLNCFDVLVLPSKTTPTWKEQFGHILVESMACGVPVIGSSSGEIPNVIGEAGLIFQEEEAGDLSAKLTRLFHDVQLRQTLKERGFRRVQERYTDARIAANMLALYETALDMERRTTHTLELDLI